jgi:nucleoside-diphosphate-sugar epimerase
VTKRLVEDGYSLRVLARDSSNVGPLEQLGVEIVLGDMCDEASVAAAVSGVEVVVHAAAVTNATAKEVNAATIQGVRNVLEACRAQQVRKLIYISSCNVYEVAGYADDQEVNEDAQLERLPQCRGAYSWAKQHAEMLVTSAMNREKPAVVVLRPGTIYGPGAPLFTSMLGLAVGRRLFIVFGSGDFQLPLVYAENLVDAIVACIRNEAANNQIFNVVDADTVTKKKYMNSVMKRLTPDAIVVYVPLKLLLTLTWCQEKLMRILGRPPLLTVYRVLSSQKRVRYSTSKIEKAIGWRSCVNFEQGVEHLMKQQARVCGQHQAGQ